MAAMPPKNGAPKGMQGPARPNVGFQQRPMPARGVMPSNNGPVGGQSDLQQVIKLQTAKRMLGRY